MQADEPLSLLCQLMLEAMSPLLPDRVLASIPAVDLWLNQSDNVSLIATSETVHSAGRSDDQQVRKEQIRLAAASGTTIQLWHNGSADLLTSDTNSPFNTVETETEVALISACRLSEYHDLLGILRLAVSPGESNQPSPQTLQSGIHSKSSSAANRSEYQHAEAGLWNYVCGDQNEQRQLLSQALTALTGCVAERVSRILLTNFVQRQQDQAAVSDIVRQLHHAGDVQEAAGVLSTQAVRLLGHGRISILQPTDAVVTDLSAWKVISITGAATVRQDSEVIQHLQLLAEQMKLPEGVVPDVIPWHSTAVAAITPSSDQSPQTVNSALAWFGAAGVNEVAMLPLKFGSENDGGQSVLLMCIELFDVAARPSDSLVRVLTEETRLALRTLTTSHHRLKRRSLRTRLKFILPIIVVSLLALWLIPADFIIKAEGQLFPQERRRLFAPDQGIVEEVLVSADETVDSGQVLLRLRNSERDLELNRLLGEHESARTRLQAIRTSRSIGTGPGSAAQGRNIDLSGDEQQWHQRLRTKLVRQR